MKTASADHVPQQWPEILRWVAAGEEVHVTEHDQVVARVVPASEKKITPGGTLRLRSFKGHRVLTPVISQADLADELFARK